MMHISPLVLAVCSLLAIAATYCGTAFIRRWAAQRLLDVPNERSSHKQPTPRGGGLAIVVCTLTGLWGICFGLDRDFPLGPLLTYSLGAVCIATVSWCDDLWSLSNKVRFLAHAIGAVLILLCLTNALPVRLPFLGNVALQGLGGVLVFLWIAGFTNAYNFMDGIDGIAGGQAVIAGVAWVGLGWWGGAPLLSVLGALVASSSLGFLGHNWPPARIFMGDVGSAFLGYTFAVMAVFGYLAHPRLFLAGVLVVWPFVFDTAFTLLRRLRRRENIFLAHRSHLYQRLIIVGYSHRFVTAAYLGLALCGVLFAWVWSLSPNVATWTIASSLGVLCFGLWQWVIQAEVRALSCKTIL
ncbi:MAG: glycosyltransferase family 4 protein [Candidatus Tectimicrobiota bacterium]